MYEVEKLYWWNKMPNFGDAISPEVVAYVLGAYLPHAEKGDNNVLMSIGSILHLTEKFNNTIIWGTGCDPGRYGLPKHNSIYLAVRGPKTRDLLGLGRLPLGDPGLLMPRIYPREPEPTNEIGVVIHHTTAQRRLRDLLFDPYRTSFRIIDPRNHWRLVIDEICRCRFVFCQSLHGAIVAQAYGVPWAWWRGLYGYFVTFKWADYFGSIGIEPKAFHLRQVRAAEQWAAHIKPRVPDLDNLAGALIDNVQVIK